MKKIKMMLALLAALVCGGAWATDIVVLNNQYVTTSWAKTDWHVRSVDDLLRYSYTGIMNGSSISKDLSGRGFFVSKNEDGTVTFQMQVRDNGGSGNDYLKATKIAFKVDADGYVHVKNLGATNQAGANVGTELMSFGSTAATADNNGTYGVKRIVATPGLPSAFSKGGVKMWLDASDESTITVDSDGVKKWTDKFCNAQDATPAESNSSDEGRVTRYATVETVNGNKAIQMGEVGSGIDLGFTSITDVRTVFWVMDIKQSGNAFFLGYAGAENYHFHRGGAQYVNNNAHNNVKNGVWRCDGFGERPTSDSAPTGHHIYTLVTTGNVSANRISEDRYVSEKRNGGRAISELIIFNRALSTEEVEEVEAYLNNKWTVSYPSTKELTTNDSNFRWRDFGDDSSNSARSILHLNADAEVQADANKTTGLMVLDIAPGKTLTFDSHTFTANIGVIIKGGGTVKTSSVTKFGDAAHVYVEKGSTWELDNGSNNLNLKDNDLTRVTGDGTIKIAGTAWAASPNSSKMWSPTLKLELANNAGFGLYQQNTEYTIGSLSGIGKLRSDFNTTGTTPRRLRILQNEDTEWTVGIAGGANIVDFIVDAAPDAENKTLTLTGTYSENNFPKLSVDVAGSAKLSATMKTGALEISGEFGGSGTINGATTARVNTGATIRADWGAPTINVAPTFGSAIKVVADTMPQEGVKLFTVSGTESETALATAFVTTNDGSVKAKVVQKADGIYAVEDSSIDPLAGKLKYGYQFNGNGNSMSGASANLGTLNYGDAITANALTIGNNAGSHYGTGFSFGDGEWSIVALLKATGVNECIFAMNGQKSSNGLVGLRYAGGNKVCLFTKEGVGDLCSVTTPDNAMENYHLYTIVYSNGKIKMALDDGEFTTPVAFTTGTGGQWQFGGIHGNGIANFAVNAGGNRGALDEFRVYTTALTREMIADLDVYEAIVNGRKQTLIPALGVATANELPLTLLNTEVAAGDLTVPANTKLTITNAENITLNSAAAFGGTGNVILEFHTPDSYASTSDLIAFMKAASTRHTFKFFGESTSGFTLDFAQANTTINSHIAFIGGTHNYKWKNGDTRWAANGSYANPNMLVEDDTIVNFYGHDITGYNGSNANGVIRVKKGGTLNFLEYGNGTVYFTQQIALDPGSTMNVQDSDMDNKAFRMTGSTTLDHIVVVASDAGSAEADRTATINVADNKWALPKDCNSAMGVNVGANSILKFNGGIRNDGTGNHEFYKRGEGSLVITCGTEPFEPKMIVSAGSVTMDKKPGSIGAVNGTLTINDTTITAIDTSSIALGENGVIDLRGCTALTSATVYAGASRDATAALPTNVLLPQGTTVIRTYHETREEYANCSFKVANATGVTVKVKRPDGTLAETTVDDDGFAKMNDFGSEIRITNWATAFDIVYENTSAFVHKDVSGAISQSDSTITYNKEGTGHDVGALLKHHPYINNIGNAWFEATEALTLAVVGTMSEQPRTTFIHMGYSIDGYTGLLIATGEKKDEVIIAWNDHRTVSEITRMSVPNAASERHVYIVTKSDVGDKSTFTVYLDGKSWKTVSIDRITIKGGVQVGSDFGGEIRGYGDSTKSWYDPQSKNYFAGVADTDNTGLVNLIRVYDRVITEAEIREYSKANQYPYYPPHGASTRVFAGETANWLEADEPPTAWSVTPKGGSATPANAPAEGSSLSTTLSAENTAITINVPAAGIVYEELEVIGSGSATFEKGVNSGAISVSGAATLYRPITVKPGSIDLSKTPITLSEEGAIHFDYSSYNVMTTYVTTKVNLTGEVVKNNAKITFTPPTTSNYRTVTMSYDEDLKQYVMTITPNHENGASVYYDTTSDVTPGNQGGRVWNAPQNPKSQTAVFPNDTIVFGYGSFNKPSWFFKDVVGSTFEFASDMSLGHGASGDAGKLFDGKTVKVNDGVTLTLRGSWRNVALGTVTTTGTGSIEFVADEGNHPYYEPTADSISGTAKIVVASGMTLTVTGSVGCPVEVNGTIKAGSEITTVTTTKANCFVAMTVEDGVYTYTAVEVTGDKPLPLDDIKPGESVTPAQDAKPIWEDTEPVEGEGGKYIKVVDGALVVKSGAPVNGLDSFTSYVLGLDPEVATSKPYLSGADTTSTTTLKLIPAGVTVKDGYTVTPKLRVGTTPTAFSDDSTALTDGGFTITLPTEENDKVKYYQIEYTISK